MSIELENLDIPTIDEPTEWAREYVRFWVVDGVDHVALRIGSLSNSGDEPEQWGCVVADIVKHVINGLILDNPESGTQLELLSRIESGYRDRMKSEAKLSGRLGGAYN